MYLSIVPQGLVLALMGNSQISVLVQFLASADLLTSVLFLQAFDL